MGFHGKHFDDINLDSTPQMSFGALANYVSRCASIAMNLHYSPLLLQGILNLDPQLWKSYPQKVFATIGMSATFFDAAKRGILVQREYLNYFEVELGMLYSQAYKQVGEWQSGNPNRFIRNIFLMVPLSLAAGYEISTRDSFKSGINIKIIQHEASQFIAESIPDDVVAVIEMLFTLGENDKDMGVLADAKIVQSIEDFEKSELSLLDFFKMSGIHNLVYEELSNNFEIIFNTGLHSFEEAFNETNDIVTSIGHTYLSLLSEYKDSYLIANGFDEAARKALSRGKEVMDMGGLLTDEGKKGARDLINSMKGITPRSIEALTSSVTFLAVLGGIRP